MRFDVAAPRRIAFGPSRVAGVGDAAAALGLRALLVTGATPARAEPVARRLAEAGLGSVTATVEGEPTVTRIEEIVARAAAEGCDVVVSVGGGSVVDAGKAAAALAAAPGPTRRYLEVIGEGHPLEADPLPHVAVPTTAGTGAEVTKNAVLGVPHEGLKVSLRDARMVPQQAIVDPELTHGLPVAVTVRTGLDALTQLIEPFTSPEASPVTDALCRDGIPRAARALPRVARTAAEQEAARTAAEPAEPAEPAEDVDAREDMALAALLGGLALANAKLGAVHGFAGPLGGLRPAPHGAICGRLLPVVTEANLRALREREPAHPALDRYAEVARLLTGHDAATADDAVAFLEALVGDLDVPGLAAWGVTEGDVPGLVTAAARASSMRGNPIELTEDERAAVLRHAL